MGIAPYVAEAIIREHKFKPIRGDVLLLGRQTMLFSPDEAIAMLRRLGVEPAPLTEPIIDRRTLASQGKACIRDDAFFRLLGVSTISALDHTDYEGAEIIHDLNQPLPERLEGVADFILDGSTLDNLFAPSVALQSMARMLKPGGRLIAINMGSAHYVPYTIFTPYWFLDYFAINEFSDAKIYTTFHYRHGMHVIVADPSAPIGNTSPSSTVTGIIAFAEKGDRSTSDRLPDQRHYASEATLDAYQRAAGIFSQSGRPDLLIPTKPRGRPLWRRLASAALRLVRRLAK